MSRARFLATLYRAGTGAALVTGALLGAAPPAHAADFFLYLKCEGTVRANGKSLPGHVDLALRDNNMTALIQRSDTLPVGERLKYQVSPMTYSMVYQLPGAHTTLLHDWWNGKLFVWEPSLKRLATIRLSIDRQSGALSGELLNADATQLGTLAMDCDAMDPEALPAPKF